MTEHGGHRDHGAVLVEGRETELGSVNDRTRLERMGRVLPETSKHSGVLYPDIGPFHLKPPGRSAVGLEGVLSSVPQFAHCLHPCWCEV